MKPTNWFFFSSFQNHVFPTKFSTISFHFQIQIKTFIILNWKVMVIFLTFFMTNCNETINRNELLNWLFGLSDQTQFFNHNTISPYFFRALLLLEKTSIISRNFLFIFFIFIKKSGKYKIQLESKWTSYFQILPFLWKICSQMESYSLNHCSFFLIIKNTLISLNIWYFLSICSFFNLN
jgi:hypothetical protein